MRFIHFLTGLVHSHKRWLFFVWSTIVIWFLWSDVGFAVDDDKTARGEIINGLNRIAAFISTILGLASMLIGAMLHPNWTDGSVVGLSGNDGGVLKKMWILISNIVYFLFALIFVGIAFLTIYRGENYQLKEKLPRFIAGILIVPFSWFIVQFVISISSLLTYSVLTLPFDTFPELKIEETLGSKNITCKKIIIDTDPENKSPISPKNLDDCKDGFVKLIDIIKNPNNDDGIFGIMTIYTYGIFEIQKLNHIELTDAGSLIKTFMALSSTALFDLIFLIVYMLIIIALTLALFVRGIYMWMYAMFAPAFGLIWFLGKEKEGALEGKFGIMQFIHLAMIPVYVGAALSFGLLFIFAAGMEGKGITNGGTNFSDNGVLVIGDYTTNKKTADGKDIYQTSAIVQPKMPITKGVKPEGVMTIDFIGPQGTYIGTPPKADSLRSQLTGYGGIAGVLLLRLFGLAILYMTVMLALKSSKVTESIANPFFEFGKSIGSMLAKAPLNTPMIPTGTKHGALSISGLQNIGQKLDQAALNAGRQSADAFGDDLVKELFPNLNKAVQNLSNAALKFETAGNRFTADSLLQLEPELKNMNDDTWNRAINNPKIRAMLAALYGEDVVKMEFGAAKQAINKMTAGNIEKRISAHNKDLSVDQVKRLAQQAKGIGGQGTPPPPGGTPPPTPPPGGTPPPPGGTPPPPGGTPPPTPPPGGTPPPPGGTPPPPPPGG